MSEKPILFSAPMVREILEGRKTQTRRVVKPQPIEGFDIANNGRAEMYAPTCINKRTGEMYPGKEVFGVADAEQGFPCPYASALGDRLWVRETFFDARPFKHQPLFAAMDLDYIYRADYAYREGKREPSVIGLHHWKPSIFMPRIASRITLEIVSVRVERLRDISEDDAIAEGLHRDSLGL